MRKFTLSVALVLGCTYSTFAQIPFQLQSKLIDTQKIKTAAKEANDLWKPAHETLYMPDDNDGWTKDSEHYYTYDTSGNILVSLSDDGKQKIKIVSTYDENGQLLTETTYRTDNGSDELKPRMMKEYTYLISTTLPRLFSLVQSAMESGNTFMAVATNELLSATTKVELQA